MAGKRQATILCCGWVIFTAIGCQSVKPPGWISTVLRSPSTETVVEDEPEPLDPTKKRLSLLTAQAELAETDNEPVVAIQAYESILELEPKRVGALHRLAVLQTQQGNVSGAEQRFQEAFKLADKHAGLHNDYGYFCYLQGKHELAIEHLKTALTLDPKMREVHNNLGLVLASTGKIHEAEIEFQRAGCTRSEALNNVAFGQLMQKNVSGAATTYAQALQQDPNHVQARRGLESLNKVAQINAATDPRSYGAVQAAMGPNARMQYASHQGESATTGNGAIAPAAPPSASGPNAWRDFQKTTPPPTNIAPTTYVGG
jgi:Tfp pilus assembly protein PilF